MNTQNQRKIKVIHISAAIFCLMFDGHENHFKTIGGMFPKDAEIISAEYDWSTQSIKILVRSEEFEVIEVGSKFPVIDIILEDIHSAK